MLKLSQAVRDSLRELIALAGDEVNEVEVEKRLFGWKIRVSKSSGAQVLRAVAQPVPPAGSQPLQATEEPPAEQQANGIPIPSPMVGTFYRSPSPDADPFVKEGDVVSPGQTVCIIEAMKIMNEIEAEVGGRVTQVLPENGSPVEYDTPLFLVEPV